MASPTLTSLTGPTVFENAVEAALRSIAGDEGFRGTAGAHSGIREEFLQANRFGFGHGRL